MEYLDISSSLDFKLSLMNAMDEEADGHISPSEEQLSLINRLREIVNHETEESYVLSATCPEPSCLAQIFFSSNVSTIDCHSCLQTHSVDKLLNVYEPEDKIDVSEQKIYRFGTDFVKVDGLSNFHCKLLSPCLTKYGMDRSGKAILLEEMGHSKTIDCGKVLGNRSFTLPLRHIEVRGFGKDRSGSIDYLNGLLEFLKEYHSGEERLIPIHVDGDGHCLVHALSRALTGRELFWHGLRQNLYEHLKQRLHDYMIMFQDFHSKEEWDCIIAEANPDCTSSDGITVGLGNIHIFALSNILKRPIMLLNSLQKIHCRGDYSGLFVPALVEPSQCSNRSPICIAWSGAAHNHFVPLVSVEGKALPTIPSQLVPDLWGVPIETGQNYLNYNEDGSLTVCGGKPISIKYLQRLASAMETVFLQQHVVSPSVVEGVCRFVYNLNETPGVHPKDLISLAANAALENRLYHCLNCHSLLQINVSEDELQPNGRFYNLAVQCHKELESTKIYFFPESGLKCLYQAETDRLTVFSWQCIYCRRFESRRVDVLGKIDYKNGDRTENRNCYNGRKIFWNGWEYDVEPKTILLNLTIKNEIFEISIVWFYGNSDPELNSDPVEEAKKIVRQYYPQDSDSDEIVQSVAQIIKKSCQQQLIKDDRFSTSVNEEARSSKTSRDKSIGSTSGKNSPTISQHNKSKDNSINCAVRSQPVIAPKRKSDGAPTKSASGSSPTKCVDQKTIVKISLKNGQTETVRLEPSISMDDLQRLIKDLFEIEPSEQILKRGFPPRLLSSELDGGSLSLQSGDKITVEIKKNPPLPTQTVQLEKPTSMEIQFSDSMLWSQESKRNQMMAGFRDSNHSCLWDYVMEKPELFYSGGYFYEKFKEDVGMADNQHCRFPLLDKVVFCYNQNHDRIEVCMEPIMGHHAIDDDIRHHYKNYTEALRNQPSTASVHEVQLISDGENLKNEAFENTPKVTFDEPSKSGVLAPGYRTLGEKPTEVSETEKLLQRESLLKMVEHIKSKQSSS